MFDIAWTELLVVAVIAIIVVGPKELPGMLRAFGKTFGQVRKMSREFQSTFSDALREAERQVNLDEVKRDMASVGKLDPTKDLRKELSDTKQALSGKVGDARTPAPDVVPLKGAEALREEPKPGDAPKPRSEEPKLRREEPKPASAAAGPRPVTDAASGPVEDDAPRAAAGADRR